MKTATMLMSVFLAGLSLFGQTATNDIPVQSPMLPEASVWLTESMATGWTFKGQDGLAISNVFLPHTWTAVRVSNMKGGQNPQVKVALLGTYTREVDFPPTPEGLADAIFFERVVGRCRVYLGKTLYVDHDGDNPFVVVLRKSPTGIKETLTVKVSSVPENLDHSLRVNGTVYLGAGIYGEVSHLLINIDYLRGGVSRAVLLDRPLE
jgi:hypothetical protein